MVTVTQAVLAAAGEHGDRAAVIDASDGRRITYAGLAAAVPAAACGLARRGIRAGDVAAVHLRSALDYALATHALTAAGAVPAPVCPGADADRLAGHLNECAARLMVTAGPLARQALEAADRSSVRQVFSFGDVPSATPFAELTAETSRVPATPSAPGGGEVALLLCDEGPPPVAVTHAERVAALRVKLGEWERAWPGRPAHDTVVAALARRRARHRADLVDAALWRGATLVGVAERGPEAFLRAVRDHGATVAVVEAETFGGGPGEQCDIVIGAAVEIPRQRGAGTRRRPPQAGRAIDLYSR